MTRRELVQEVSAKTGLSKKDAEAAVVALLQSIHENLLRGKTIVLRGFGTFGLKYQRARKGRIIRSGEAITIPPRLRVSFVPSPILQKAVAENKDLLDRFASE